MLRRSIFFLVHKHVFKILVKNIKKILNVFVEKKFLNFIKTTQKIFENLFENIEELRFNIIFVKKLKKF